MRNMYIKCGTSPMKAHSHGIAGQMQTPAITLRARPSQRGRRLHRNSRKHPHRMVSAPLHPLSKRDLCLKRFRRHHHRSRLRSTHRCETSCNKKYCNSNRSKARINPVIGPLQARSSRNKQGSCHPQGPRRPLLHTHPRLRRCPRLSRPCH